MRTPEEILRSIIVDVEAEANYSENALHPSDAFGPFSQGWNEADGVGIEWPNLQILIDEAKEALGCM